MKSLTKSLWQKYILQSLIKINPRIRIVLAAILSLIGLASVLLFVSAGQHNLQSNKHSKATTVQQTTTTSSQQTTPSSQATTGTPSQNATNITSQQQPPNFTSFSDWRAAYLGSDNHMHAVTLDNKQTLTGPSLPDFTTQQLGFGNGSISPDGHTLAYAAPSLDIVDLAGKVPVRHFTQIAAIYQLTWFRDGKKFALVDSGGNIWIADDSGNAPIAVPGGPFASRSILDGWIDATHLAVSGYGPPATATDQRPTIFYIDSLDVTTGQLHSVASVTDSNLGDARVILSPDGTEAFFANLPFQDYPFTPLATEINMSTGASTQLPQIAQIINTGFNTLAWQPGSQTIAASTGFLENNNLQTWSFDVQHDTTSHITDGQYVEQWSPDGKTLIVSTGLSNVIGEGPYTISDVTFAANGHSVITRLTQNAVSFPFAGFIRTASS